LDPKDPIILLIPLIGIALILLAVWLAGGTRARRLDRALVLRRLAEDLPGFAAAEIVIGAGGRQRHRRERRRTRRRHRLCRRRPGGGATARRARRAADHAVGRRPFHRLSRHCRFWWAAHINHHTAQHCLRQTWTGGIFEWVLWLPRALAGFPPALVVFAKGVGYQFWIRTETIGHLPRWIEAVMNRPSHHRHHAANPHYLDRNYAGIFIIWDRLCGTFVNEAASDPCRYGIVRDIGSFSPLRIALHEWVAILRDLRAARSGRERVVSLLGAPGLAQQASGVAP
jgi:Fatty acid hydroxylase superfamily